MAKYDKELEDLMKKWSKEQEEYNKTVTMNHDSIAQQCNKFNSLVTIINSERHMMRREIKELHLFLKQFGDIGEKVTLFDFSPEDWLFYDGKNINATNINGNENTKNNDIFNGFITASTMATIGQAVGIGGIASYTMGGAALGTIAGAARLAPLMGVASVATPFLAPVSLIPIAVNFVKNNADKKEYEKKLQEYKQDSIRMKKAISDSESILANNINMITIANLYRVVVASVRDTIADVIIPELNGISAFLYADAIKNCIINGEDPEDAKITGIAEYKDTPYNEYYMFIKNTYDYYSLISKIFREPILSNIVNGSNIKEKDYIDVQKKLNSVIAQQDVLKVKSSFGGEL